MLRRAYSHRIFLARLECFEGEAAQGMGSSLGAEVRTTAAVAVEKPELRCDFPGGGAPVLLHGLIPVPGCALESARHAPSLLAISI
jgi:hypothetical protein